jgi:hypothetical protein
VAALLQAEERARLVVADELRELGKVELPAAEALDLFAREQVGPQELADQLDDGGLGARRPRGA